MGFRLIEYLKTVVYQSRLPDAPLPLGSWAKRVERQPCRPAVVPMSEKSINSIAAMSAVRQQNPRAMRSVRPHEHRHHHGRTYGCLRVCIYDKSNREEIRSTNLLGIPPRGCTSLNDANNPFNTPTSLRALIQVSLLLPPFFLVVHNNTRNLPLRHFYHIRSCALRVVLGSRGERTRHAKYSCQDIIILTKVVYHPADSKGSSSENDQ